MIVVVDDDAETGFVLTTLLKREGLEGRSVTNSAAALDLIKSLKPAVIVIDQMMPGLKGTDVLRTIRGMKGLSDIPVIFYSAADDWKNQEEAKRLGATAWLTKGRTTWAQLIQKIRGAYELRLSQVEENGLSKP